jgi:hypothetical protein
MHVSWFSRGRFEQTGSVDALLKIDSGHSTP